MAFKNGIPQQGEIVIYQSKDKKVHLEVNLEHDTVWLTQAQIAKVFQTDRSVITKHLSNIFDSKELDKKSNVHFLHIAFSDKPVKLYSLDVIVSVGYRVNSRRATQFRIWTTGILKKHLLDGYTVNEKRLQAQREKLKSLQETIRFIDSVKSRKEIDYKEAMSLLAVISDYTYALNLLDDYDNKRIKLSETTKRSKFRLAYGEAIKAISRLKQKYSTSDLFGVEKDKSFKSSIAAIYQTFDGKELYPSVEEKAANLLYFIVKNHSFIDGNKRIAASIFLWLLEQNGLLYKPDGAKRIADNALVALTLLVAESNPREKDVIIKIVVNLINKKN
jgi:prophage maintenance system killer protein